MKNLSEDNLQYQKQILKQKAVVKSAFFFQLLNGKFQSNEEAKKKMEAAEILGWHERIIPMIIRLPILEHDERTNHWYEQIAIVVESQLSEATFLHIEKPEKLILLHTTEEVSSERIRKETEEICVGISKKLCDLGVNCQICVGSETKELVEVYLSKSRADNILDQMIGSDTTIIYADDIKPTKKEIEYSLEMEMHLMILMKAGKVEETKVLLYNLYSKAGDQKDSMLLFQYLRSTYNRFIYEEKLDKPILLGYQDVEKNSDVIFGEIQQAYEEVIQKNIKAKENSIGKKAKEYINNSNFPHQ